MPIKTGRQNEVACVAGTPTIALGVLTCQASSEELVSMPGRLVALLLKEAYCVDPKAAFMISQINQADCESSLPLLQPKLTISGFQRLTSAGSRLGKVLCDRSSGGKQPQCLIGNCQFLD